MTNPTLPAIGLPALPEAVIEAAIGAYELRAVYTTKGKALNHSNAMRDAVTAAVLADRASMRQRVLDAIPTNWCDPLLTGPSAVIGTNTNVAGIERLLLALRERIDAAMGDDDAR